MFEFAGGGGRSSQRDGRRGQRQGRSRRLLCHGCCSCFSTYLPHLASNNNQAQAQPHLDQGVPIQNFPLLLST